MHRYLHRILYGRRFKPTLALLLLFATAPRRRRRRAAPLLLLALAFLLLAAPLTAQGPGQVVLRGTVVDTESGTPLAGAYIARVGATRGTVTDSLGRFALATNRAPSYSFTIVQLGYHTLEATMSAEAGSGSFTVGLEPDPIALEGLMVLTDRLIDRRRVRLSSGMDRRLRDRRRDYVGLIRILDREELLHTPLGNAYDLTRHVMPGADLCTPEADSLCVSVEGRRTPLSICMDGRTISSAMPELKVLDPRVLFLVEAFARVGRIDIYSRDYVARLIETGQRLPPFSFGCDGIAR